MFFVESYKYLFYRIYILQLETFKGFHDPKFTALAASSLCVYFNLLTIAVLFQVISGYKIYISKTATIISFGILILLNYLIFFRKESFKLIIEKFATENDVQRAWGAIGCWAYIIGTYAAFITSILILSPYKK